MLDQERHHADGSDQCEQVGGGQRDFDEGSACTLRPLDGRVGDGEEAGAGALTTAARLLSTAAAAA